MSVAVENVLFDEELERQLGKYGYFVNRGRAFPSAIDGLKVVHRHILWGMYKMRALPTNEMVRSAKAVGEVMGNYHPHGDASIYDSMVELAQPFTQRLPLLATHGGWGSLSSPAAAPRYTKCRLAPAAMELMGVFPGASEIDEETVEFVANYDGQRAEPTVLPAAWPMYVVNGTFGIGVGMRGNFPSHNLTETMNLAIKLVDTPNPRWETITSIMPGPDFPCDADIYDTGIEGYYRTGRGSVTLRARYEVEDYPLPKRRKGHKIIITGLPFDTSPETVVGGIRALSAKKEDGRPADLPTDIEVVDSTSKSIRIEIDVKEHDPNDIITRLLAFGAKSHLQKKVSIDGSAVLEGEIVKLGVLDALKHWIEHRREVIRARSRYRLARAEARKHIVEGYLKVIPIAEAVIAIVRSSSDRSSAEARLVDELDFSEIQAKAVLDLTLAQITRLGTERFTKEIADLDEIIADARLLLSDPAALDTRMKKEMREVRDRLGSPRRCVMKEGSPNVERPSTPVVAEPAKKGYLIKTGRNWVRWTTRTNISRQVGSDHVTSMTEITDQDMVEVVDDQGMHYRMKASDLPDVVKNPAALLKVPAGSSVILVGNGHVAGTPQDVVLVTEQGQIKRVSGQEWSTRRTNRPYPLVTLNADEKVAAAFFIDAKSDIVMISSGARLLRVLNKAVLSKGAKAKTISGMRLSAGEKIVWAGAASIGQRMVYLNAAGGIGWFELPGEPKAGNLGTMGFSISRTAVPLMKVLAEEGQTLRWFGADREEPGSLTLEGQTVGTQLSDRQLRLKAEGIEQASAIWLE